MRQIAATYAPDGPAYITSANRDALKPFVLFDAGPLQTDALFGPDWHAHSGVATLTFPYISDLHHQDSGGNGGVVREGGFQWMQAGGGIWHQEKYAPRGGWVGIQQLWVQLPPSDESGPVRYFDVQPEDVVASGNTRVFVGSCGDATSRASVPVDMTYLDVTLAAGEAWSFFPPAGQTRGFAFARTGEITVADTALTTLRLGAFADSDEPIEIRAQTSASFVVAVTAPSPYPIVHSYGQMHTNAAALARGTERIRELGATLRGDGIIE